ncbi:MAG: nucleotidyltransferase family protein [Elusimicrobia bacterium]|nr:nucleotidyltransferase family protein [Elusimicrobiota bacterium]
MTAPTDYREALLPPTATMQQAMKVMTRGHAMVLVVDSRRRLQGVVVDYDLRRAMLQGHGLRTPLSIVMNPRPVTLPHGMPRSELVRFFQVNKRASVPLIDDQGRVQGLAQMADHLGEACERANWVVFLVGGLGRRLHPLTEKRPKSLLPVGDKPILETTIEQCIATGFKRFIFAVRHHAGQIKAHFGDGRRFGATFHYLNERSHLGTAGPLSLIKFKISEPLIVMNGDLLTKIDFNALLDFHQEDRHLATVCVREYEFQVPYGVVRMKGHKLEGIVEKPVHRFFVNAGIYVLDPGVLGWLPRNVRCDMPDFLEKIRRRKLDRVGCFPIREYWIDIGRIQDYRKAQTEYAQFF